VVGGTSWEAIRALARMGVKEEVARAIRVVENEPMLDRCTRLFRDLTYVRDMEVVEYLNGYVQGSDCAWDALRYS